MADMEINVEAGKFVELDDKAYTSAIAANTGANAQKRYETFINLCWNAAKKYAASADVKHINNLIELAEGNRRANTMGNLIRDLGYHPFDKKLNRYVNQKVTNKAKMKKIADQWEAIFMAWLKGERRRNEVVRLVDPISLIDGLLNRLEKAMTEHKIKPGFEEDVQVIRDTLRPLIEARMEVHQKQAEQKSAVH